jgi:cyclopropane fatty-acyl-phospholipid synthase-like methyltransferase
MRVAVVGTGISGLAAAAALHPRCQLTVYESSYARTLELWRERLLAMPDPDLRFRRLWEFYLAYCEAGFRERYVGLVQIRLQHLAR